MVAADPDALSEKEFAERVLHSSILFSDILPIYLEEQRAAFRLAFDQDLTDIIPDFFGDLARFCIKHKSEALPYFKFIHEASGWCLGLNEKPEIDYPTEEIQIKVNKQLAGWKLSEVKPIIDTEKMNEEK